MWREMLAATVRLQSPFAVAVYAPLEAQGFWDLARDHYGSNTPMSAYRSIGQVIRAVAEGRSRSGSCRCRRRESPIRGGVTFCQRTKTHRGSSLACPSDRAATPAATVPMRSRSAAPRQQETGEDRTLLVTESAADISRARIFRILSSLGLLCTFFASYEHLGGALNLIEIDGFVLISDPRLDGFRAQLGSALHRLLPLGGYAVPLPAAAPAKG